MSQGPQKAKEFRSDYAGLLEAARYSTKPPVTAFPSTSGQQSDSSSHEGDETSEQALGIIEAQMKYALHVSTKAAQTGNQDPEILEGTTAVAQALADEIASLTSELEQKKADSANSADTFQP